MEPYRIVSACVGRISTHIPRRWSSQLDYTAYIVGGVVQGKCLLFVRRTSGACAIVKTHLWLCSLTNSETAIEVRSYITHAVPAPIRIPS